MSSLHNLDGPGSASGGGGSACFCLPMRGRDWGPSGEPLMWSQDRAQILNKGLARASTSSVPTKAHLLLLSSLPRPTDPSLSSGAEGKGHWAASCRGTGGFRETQPSKAQHPLNSRKVGPPPSWFLKEAGLPRGGKEWASPGLPLPGEMRPLLN